MCKFCDSYKNNDMIFGKEFAINKCANKTDLTFAQILKNTGDKVPGIVIMSNGFAKGYFDINFCPKCGRKLLEEMKEMVRHPSHYNIPGRKECIVEMEDKYGAESTAIFCLTNAYKYIYRAGNKDGNTKEQDISKAIFYFDYANKLINGYGILYFNGTKIDESSLYLEIKVMLNEHRGSKGKNND